jgi:alanine dehydrogenase
MLLLSNDDVSQVLTMEDTIGLLDASYRDLARGEAVCRPRIDIRIPTETPGRAFQWGTMEGGAAGGYFAIRMKADIVSEQEYGGTRTQEKYCVTPGRFCGLVLLMRTADAEPVALMQDGYLQHFRVAGDGAIGARHMARQDASTLGLLGSGGMARTHVEALACVRPLRRVRVYSPTPEHREAFAAEVRRRHGLEVEVCAEPRAVYEGADILAALTDATQPVTNGEWLEPGTHVLSIGAPLDRATVDRLDISLRLGTAPAPEGLPAWGVPDEVVAYYARSGQGWWRSHHHMMDKVDSHAHRLVAPDRLVALEDLLAGRHPGRTSPSQVTYSERGNVQGAQFFPVAGRIFELARERGLGRTIPLDWLLQDIRD